MTTRAHAGEYGGMKLSSQARAALMNRLAGQGPPPGASAGGSGANTVPLGAPPGPPGIGGMGMGMPPPPGMPVSIPAAGVVIADQGMVYEQGILGPSSPIPTVCLLLKNMFDAST